MRVINPTEVQAVIEQWLESGYQETDDTGYQARQLFELLKPFMKPERTQCRHGVYEPAYCNPCAVERSIDNWIDEECS